ncbi:MAG: asparaginase [Acidobacteria bacterium]|nr:asparaginase [Acidobacteriota bacterium]
MTLPRIAILTTGGTIAGKWDDAQGGVVPVLSGEELVRLTPGLSRLAEPHIEQIANVDSSNMQPEVWLRLSQRVNHWLALDDVVGVVVTHGTDTLEETAYLLDLTTTSPKPVVIVGAQRPPTFPDSDAPRNLLDAVRVALSPEATGMGTLVVMNGQVNAARDVTKTSTTEREAFQSLEFGPLGVADIETVRFYRAPMRRRVLALAGDAVFGRVEIVMHYAGADGLLIRALADAGVAGLVVAATGLGQVSEAMFDAIRDLRERGVPVVISTRVYTGRVIPLYGSQGGVGSLLNLGCILAGNLSPVKARVMLMVALAAGFTTHNLQQCFDW